MPTNENTTKTHYGKIQDAEGFNLERIDELPSILLQRGISRFDTLLLLLYKQELMHLRAIERTIQFAYICDSLLNEKFRDQPSDSITKFINTLLTQKPSIKEYAELVKEKVSDEVQRIKLVGYINREFPYIDIPGNKRVYTDLKVLHAMKLITLIETKTGKRTVSKLAAIDSDFYRIWEARRRELLVSSNYDPYDKLLSDFYRMPIPKDAEPDAEHYSIYLRYAEYL